MPSRPEDPVAVAIGRACASFLDAPLRKEPGPGILCRPEIYLGSGAGERMSIDGIHGCTICGKPTYFSYRFYSTPPRAEADQGVYEIGCSACGEYRIAASAETAMTRQSPLYRATMVRMIQAANARGNRYCLDDGGEVSLSSLATPTSVAAVPDARARITGTYSGHTPAGDLEPVVIPTSPAGVPSRTPEPR